MDFVAWCEELRPTLSGIEPVHVATSDAKQVVQEAAPDVAEGPSVPANHIEVPRLDAESSGGSRGPPVLDEVGSLVADASLGLLEHPMRGGLALRDDGGLGVAGRPGIAGEVGGGLVCDRRSRRGRCPVGAHHPWSLALPSRLGGDLAATMGKSDDTGLLECDLGLAQA